MPPPACRVRPIRPARLHRVAIAATLLAAGAAAAAQPATVPIVVGLRPGMSEAEVLATLKAHDPALELRRTSRRFSYSDGVQRLQTPEQLWLLVANKPAGSGDNETIRIAFSTGPGAQRVVGIDRNVILRNPPLAQQVIAQLNAKYGAPLDSHSHGMSPQTRQTAMVWAQPGKPTCWRLTPKTTGIGFGDGQVLQQMQVAQQRGVAPRDLSQCGWAIQASLSGDPVRTLQVRVADYGLWTASDLHAAREVEARQRQAVEERKARGSGPKL